MRWNIPHSPQTTSTRRRQHTAAAQIGRSLAAAAALLLTSACINEDALCPDAASDGRVTLHLRVVTQSSASTRAAGHDTQAGTIAENFINLEAGDFKVLVFDEFGVLYEEFVPTTATPSGIVTGPSDDAYSVYTLSGQIVPVSSQIQVMVLANWNSFKATNPSYPAYDAGVGSSYVHFTLLDTKLPNLYRNDGGRWTYTYPADATGAPGVVGQDATVSSWQPTFDATNAPADNHGIPMFGISDLAPLSSLTDQTSTLDLGTIQMLRAIAKIEVIDHIADEQVSLTDLSLSTYNTTGCFFPNVLENPQWNQLETQVTTPSLPESPASATNLTFIRTTRTNAETGAEESVFIAYVPEMEFTETEAPSLRFTITNQIATEENGFPQTTTYTKALYPYVVDADLTSNGSREATGTLLRNHIYRLEVLSASSILTLRYGICPWEEERFDIPEFD